ncbi:unnamed protein product [Closterium sp. Naga37s-1]|nr:unnamed protein product [Closterium sp. Naga37s-1]
MASLVPSACHSTALTRGHSTAALRIDSSTTGTCTSLAVATTMPARPHALSCFCASPFLRRSPSLGHSNGHSPSLGASHGVPRRWSFSCSATAREAGGEAAEVGVTSSSALPASSHEHHELAGVIAARPAAGPGTGLEETNVGHESTRAAAQVATASLSQALLRRSSRTVATVSAAAATAGRPGARMTGALRGKGGVVVAVVLAVAGIATLVMREHQHQHEHEHEEHGNECELCGGYGLHCCTLCKGTGLIRWEGKFDRNDPCSACVGEGCSKCPECGGVKIRRAGRTSSHRRTPFLPLRSFRNPLFAPLPPSRPCALRASKAGSDAPLSDSTGGEGQQPRKDAERSSGAEFPPGALNGASRPGAGGGGGGGDVAVTWGDGQKKDVSGGWSDPSDLDQSRSSAGNPPGLPEFAAGFVLLLGLGALAFAGLHKRGALLLSPALCTITSHPIHPVATLKSARVYIFASIAIVGASSRPVNPKPTPAVVSPPPPVSSAGRTSAPKPPEAAVVGTLLPSSAQPSPSGQAPTTDASAATAAAPASALSGSEGSGSEKRGETGAERQAGGEGESGAKRAVSADGAAGTGGMGDAASSRGVDPSLNDLLLPSQIVAAATVAADTPPPLPFAITLPHPGTTTGAAAAAAAASSEAAGRQQGEEKQALRGEAAEQAGSKAQGLEQLLSGNQGEAGAALSALGVGGGAEEEGEDVVGPFAAEMAESVSELRPWLEAMQAEQAGEGAEGGEAGEKAMEGRREGGGEVEGASREKADGGGKKGEGVATAEDVTLSGVPAVASVADSDPAAAPAPAAVPSPPPAAAAADSASSSAGGASPMPWGMAVFVPAPLSAAPPAAGGAGEARAGQVVVRAAVDSSQHTALEALQALEVRGEGGGGEGVGGKGVEGMDVGKDGGGVERVIEEGVDAAGICSRREFARWLVHASNTLSRAASDRIYPAMYVYGSTALAFDDVPASDPDFPYIQGLAEAGLIASKLSHADLGCPRAAAAARRRGCSAGASAAFRPDCALTRQDLISWKLSLDYHNMMPLQPKEDVVAVVGFIDAERVDEDALPAIAQDVLRGDRSIIAAAFGFTRRFDPHKPVTRGQAAVALAGGGVSEVVAGEMARVEAEHIAEAAMAVVQEEAAAAAAAEAAVLAAKEEAVAAERRRREEAERAAEAAVARVERIETELQTEKEELEQQREVLAGMRAEARREKEEAEAALEQQRQEVEKQISKVEQERRTAEEALAEARAAAAAAAEEAEELRVEKEQLEAKRHVTEEQAQLVQDAAEELQRARLQLQRRWQQQNDIRGGEDGSSVDGAGIGTDDGGVGEGKDGSIAVEASEEEKQLLERVAGILARKQAAERENGGGFAFGWSPDAAVVKARQLLQQAVERVKAAGQAVPRVPSALAQLLQQQATSTVEGAKAAVGVALQRGTAAGEASDGGVVSQMRELGKRLTGTQKPQEEAVTRTVEAQHRVGGDKDGDAGSRASELVEEAMHVGGRLVEGVKKKAHKRMHEVKEVVDQLMERWSKKGGATP